jgi:hypothetical protein
VKVTEHHPAYVEGFKTWQGEVKSLPELVGLKFIERWVFEPRFYRFSLSRNTHGTSTHHLLMAEFDRGKVWWVVARLEGEDFAPFAGLPEWHAPEKGK